MSTTVVQIGGIALIFVIMYVLMIRPQRKREKQVNEMRSSLKVGDQVTTIGGIRGKIITVRDDALIIAVGADKVKIEVMRWAISKIDAEGPAKAAAGKTADKKEVETKEEDKPARKPRRLGATSDDDADEGENGEAGDDSGSDDEDK